MKNLRTDRKYLNNYEKLDFLNKLYQIPRSPKNIYNSTNKKSKIIILEKRSPNHYPIYVKVTKKINIDNNSIEKNKYTYSKNSPLHNFNLGNLSNKNRNSLYTEISQNQIHNSYNPVDITLSSNLNNTYDVNNLKQSLQGNAKMINNKNKKFITISPIQSSQKETKKEKNDESNIKNEIEVEENFKNKDNNNTNFNTKHKIRYLLSKNYCGKRLNKRKYFIKSPISIASGPKNNNNIKNKNIKYNLKIDVNNNNILKSRNFDNIDLKKYYNPETTPVISSNIKDNYQNRKTTGRILNTSLMMEKKTPREKNEIKLTSPNTNNNNNNKIIEEEIQYSETNNIDNIFLRNNIKANNEIHINLNDLILIEKRLNDIIIGIYNKNNIDEVNLINESVEFFSFYFNSSLQGKFPLFFNIQNRIIIKSAFNLNLLLICMIFHLSLYTSMLIKVILLMKKIFELLKINFYLIIRKIEIYYGEAFCQKNELYFKEYDSFLKENNLYDLKEKEIIDIINKNCISLTTDIENILNFYQTVNDNYYINFQNIYMSISKLNEIDIKNYFYNNLYKLISEENVIKPNIYIENTIEDNNNSEQIHDNQYLDSIILSYKKNRKIPPFIKAKTNKKYTLVLDLEDTLVNCKVDQEGNFTCTPRPGLISFLNGIKPYYEIISFTKLSKEYSDLIIREIEGNQKLFDYNLYRDHCSLIGREFVKDISIIGRNIEKIIIVDDVEENFRFHVNNGIIIKPFKDDEDRYDRVLFELKKILILLFRLNFEDIRVAIKKYKKEIYNKITMGNVE